MTNPMWTVFCNVVSPENPEYIGMSWEFFRFRADAERCRYRHEHAGRCVTIRPWHENDRKQMGAVHR